MTALPGPTGRHGRATAAVAAETRDLVKTYDDGRVRALDGVTLTIRREELVVLIGRSGSGKSTLLRHLNGLERATSGTVQVLGVDPARCGKRELRALRRRIGFVFQHSCLVGRLSALENVLTGALGRIRFPRYGVLSYPNVLRRAACEQLDRVGLADQAFQRADTLSGGQRQRVAIARALFQQPELMLADEPVASLDPETSAQVMALLFALCREDGLTAVCSLHQVDLALGWAHRMVGMRAGVVVLDRTASQLTPDDARGVYQAQDAEGARREPAHEHAATTRDLHAVQAGGNR